jgi:DNA helicase-2/ATP-dependent DNA helicase PcrA
LEEISLITDMDIKDERNDYVTLMTIHTSKWLEERRVFVTGVEDWIFPSIRSVWEQATLEEERRLMYVAMTRAKEELYISRAMERFHFWDYMRNPESRFIKEIPKEYIEKYDLWELIKTSNNFFSSYNSNSKNNTLYHSDELASREWGGKRGTSRGEFQNQFNVKNSLYNSESYKSKTSIQNNDISQFSIWDKVSHPKFWNGIITELNGEIASIAFSWNSIKKMNIKLNSRWKKRNNLTWNWMWELRLGKMS